VLDALAKAGSDIRGKLGESLSTVKKFDTPWSKHPPLLWKHCKPIAWDANDRRQRFRRLDCSAAARHQARSKFCVPTPASPPLITIFPNQASRAVRTESLRSARPGQRARKTLYRLSLFLISSPVTREGQPSYAAWAQSYPRDEKSLYDLGSIDASLGH